MPIVTLSATAYQRFSKIAAQKDAGGNVDESYGPARALRDVWTEPVQNPNYVGQNASIFCAPLLTYCVYAALRCSKIEAF